MDKSVGLRGYCCFNCRNIVADHNDMINKEFLGRHEKGSGRAFLFSHAINVVEEPPYYMQMISGPHVVSDILCAECGKNLGWKYKFSFRDVNKYKEGKIVMVKYNIIKV
ncbi:hypothetical protein R3W88_002649 [Solanum pinnatisectum]|uniref:Protein yippee-like n=1 Tax=Solanum pinnatisectum TaxID=50273 RepID=A0AAV9MLS6_9SOLN|nr:hypothetical protein R3W88_002649 [Solanum pinnatisectum]